MDERVEGRATRPPIVILNPQGNRGRTGRLRKPLEHALASGRGELALTHTTAEAEACVRQAVADGREVVAVGGDGTIAVIANALLAAGSHGPLGIVPAGSGNDYAYETLRLPHDPLEALEVALTGDPVAMDVGTVNGRYFLNSLGVGIDANVAAAAESLKRYPFMRGQTLYWASSLRELFLHYNRCPALEASLDNQHIERQVYALFAINIGPTAGGGFHVNPDADPHDGYFDVCIVKKPPLLRALQLLPMVEKGTHITQPEVERARVRAIALRSQTPVFAHLDGEIITATSFEVAILPGHLRVRQPRA
jgi:diacylglycerol kinase (ATP)